MPLRAGALIIMTHRRVVFSDLLSCCSSQGSPESRENLTIIHYRFSGAR